MKKGSERVKLLQIKLSCCQLKTNCFIYVFCKPQSNHKARLKVDAYKINKGQTDFTTKGKNITYLQMQTGEKKPKTMEIQNNQKTLRALLKFLQITNDGIHQSKGRVARYIIKNQKPNYMLPTKNSLQL